MHSLNKTTNPGTTLFIALCFFGICALSSCAKESTAVSPPAVEEPSSIKVGLQGHWELNGNANDKSEHARHGAIIGAISTRDRNGADQGAYQFNGTSDYIQFGNIQELSLGGFGKYTISAWVKPDSAGGCIISKWNGGVSAGWYLDVTGDGTCRSYRNVVPWVSKSLDPVSPDQWHHLLTKYDGEDLYIYVNGQLQAQDPFTSQPSDRQTAMLIGARHSQHKTSGFFQGVIDDVRIWSRDLSQEEIKWLADN